MTRCVGGGEGGRGWLGVRIINLSLVAHDKRFLSFRHLCYMLQYISTCNKSPLLSPQANQARTYPGSLSKTLALRDLVPRTAASSEGNSATCLTSCITFLAAGQQRSLDLLSLLEIFRTKISDWMRNSGPKRKLVSKRLNIQNTLYLLFGLGTQNLRSHIFASFEIFLQIRKDGYLILCIFDQYFPRRLLYTALFWQINIAWCLN